MRGWAAAVLVCIAWLIPFEASAAELRGIVAVLPFNFTDAQLDKASKTAFAESVGLVTADKLGAAGYTVLVGENTLAILQENGIDPTKVCDTNCSLSAARELKASLFLSATVTTLEKTHVVFVRLFESQKGTQLSSVEFQGKSALELNQQFRARAHELFGKLLGSGEARGHKALVKFETTPPGAVVSVDGELVCQTTPCAQELPIGTHRLSVQKARHQTVQRTVNVERGLVVRESLTPRFATVTVVVTPPDVALSVDGQPPAVVEDPLELDEGVHALVIDSPCWLRAEEKFEVAAGEQPTVRLTPTPRVGTLAAVAKDAAGKEVEAVVEVDGKRVGVTPGQFPVSVCAREVVMTGANGARWQSPLELKEGELFRAEGLLGAPVGSASTAVKKRVGMSMVAVGLVTVAVGAGLGLAARAAAADLRTNARPGAEAQAQIDSANTKAIAANVLLGAGGVLALTGVGVVVVF